MYLPPKYMAYTQFLYVVKQLRLISEKQWANTLEMVKFE